MRVVFVPIKMMAYRGQEEDVKMTSEELTKSDEEFPIAFSLIRRKSKDAS